MCAISSTPTLGSGCAAQSSKAWAWTLLQLPGMKNHSVLHGFLVIVTTLVGRSSSDVTVSDRGAAPVYASGLQNVTQRLNLGEEPYETNCYYAM